MKKNQIKNLAELEIFAKNFLKNLDKNFKENKNQATLILLKGDLGSGKTSFVQKIGKILKIKEKINSPTFTISKIYKIPKNNFLPQKNLIHIDAYRLGEKNSLKNIGLEDQLKNCENIIFLEWPEMLKKDIEKFNSVKLNFEYKSKEEREIFYS